MAWSYLPLLPVALFALLFFVAALGILLGSINVYLRDTAHFVELALIAWFFMTPIVYPYETVAAEARLPQLALLLNPITDIVLTFQRAIYGQVVEQPRRPTASRPSRRSSRRASTSGGTSGTSAS